MQLTLKTPRLYSIYRCIERKYFLWKRLRLDLIFTRQDFFMFFFVSRTLFPVILFAETLWQPPYYFRKNNPRNKKLRSLFPLTFCPLRTSENWNFFTKFFISVFPGFLKKLVSCDFLWPSPSVLFTVIILNNSFL